jgi:hypothetical protein
MLQWDDERDVNLMGYNTNCAAKTRQSDNQSASKMTTVNASLATTVRRLEGNIPKHGSFELCLLCL